MAESGLRPLQSCDSIGTQPTNRVTLNNPAGRQILLLGLMAFMFLCTAYSANVVALLQSPTNDINSVETLLSSPLVCGAQDVLYNRNMFLVSKQPYT